MTPVERPNEPLPWLLRVAAVACLVLSAFVGLGASRDLGRLFTLSTEQPPPAEKAYQALIDQMWSVEHQALESMQVPRAFLMAAMLAFTGLSLVGAARMLWPGDMSREAIRKLLATTALLVGILRTIDGAQHASIIRKMREALASFSPPPSAKLPPELVTFIQQYMPTLLLALSIGLTVVMAGGFVVLSQYLGSQRVRQLFAAEATAADDEG